MKKTLREIGLYLNLIYCIKSHPVDTAAELNAIGYEF